MTKQAVNDKALEIELEAARLMADSLKRLKEERDFYKKWADLLAAGYSRLRFCRGLAKSAHVFMYEHEKRRRKYK